MEFWRKRVRQLPRRLGGCGLDHHRHLDARVRQHRHQHVDTEQVDVSPDQVTDTWLGNATLGTNVTESDCRGLRQEQLQRDNCTWTETAGWARIVGRSNSEPELLTRPS